MNARTTPWPETDPVRAPQTDWPPPWAAAWGDDEYGLWADFEVDGVGQRMRWIEPGSFEMGSPLDEPSRKADEGPRHRVTLTQGFWLADSPCPQAFWQTVNGASVDQGSSRSDLPVAGVTHVDVLRFLSKVQANLPHGHEARLPTEVQWEYACRAGTQTAYWWGDAFDHALANAAVASRAAVTPVRQFKPNPWGLHDMHGTVWEWCADLWPRAYADQAEVDPAPVEGGTFVGILRGGSWRDPPESARAARRRRVSTEAQRGGAKGFRLVLSATGTARPTPADDLSLGVMQYPWRPAPSSTVEFLRREVALVDGKYPLSPAVAVDQVVPPWYSGIRLLRLIDPGWVNKHLAIYFLCDADDSLYRLNGTSTPILEFNHKNAIRLDASNALAYLKFFCFFVQGDEGPFYVLESMDDPLIPPDCSGTTRSVLQDSARPAVWEGPDESGDGYRCRATVWYSNALFHAHFRVMSSGMIDMLDDDPIAGDLDARANAPLA
jgi:formylglycine-generating enzyme